MKVLIFGAGQNAEKFLKTPVAKKVEIVGIVDNNEKLWGGLRGKYIIASPKLLKSIEWDRIVVTPNECKEIIVQLEKEYEVEKDRIIRISDLIVPSESNLGSVSLSCNYEQCYEINELIPEQVIPNNQMEKFYFKNSHRVMNKWWHYFEIYHTFFSKYVGTDVRILEIGVFKGGSMQMWKEYFGERATVVGVDIDERCKSFEEENVHICIGSQSDKEFLQKVSGQWGPFDIILDDGSHIMEHQIITYETMFPLLKDGGVFVCEDCHTSYMPAWGGSYKGKDTFIEYSKNFIDCVNSQHISDNEIKKIPKYAEDIKACHYYDSVVVIEKKRRGYSIVTEFEQ